MALKWSGIQPVEGYASRTSVSPGEPISFHLRTEPPHFYLSARIFRVGKDLVPVWNGSAIAQPYATPANSYEIGCNWPAAVTLMIPQGWRSGVYLARFASTASVYARPSTDILFVVKAAAPGSNSKILFQLAVDTYQAYNYWGGKSLYDYNSSDDVEADKVSFNRPTTSDSSFFSWEHDFVKWLEDNGFEIEYCTNVDLHVERDFLDNYQLLLSVGHDEYWSKDMRDNVEAFVGNGGNVAFFSGNVCWWQVRFEDSNRTMVCYRDAAQDPITPTDPSRVTVLWRAAPVNRPENRMTGVSFANGAGWWQGGARPPRGYQVRFPEHWIFDTTGLAAGDEFGQEDLVVGYETDAALFTEVAGVPQVTGADGTPLNFVLLATADLRDWGPGGQAGWATMGVFRDNGLVFTAATTDWSHGLRGSWNAVSQITQNLLRRLGYPTQSATLFNRGFEKWRKSKQDTPPFHLPDHWTPEGPGVIEPSQDKVSGALSLRINAAAGGTGGNQEPTTWLGGSPTTLRGRTHYHLGCWVKADRPGASIRLQYQRRLRRPIRAPSSRPRRAASEAIPDAQLAIPLPWQDFAVAEHSGSGEWEYLCAVGVAEDLGPLFAARVRLQVAAGGAALFDDVLLSEL